MTKVGFEDSESYETKTVKVQIRVTVQPVIFDSQNKYFVSKMLDYDSSRL